MTDAKLKCTLKVTNGLPQDARVAASYSVVVGQIHSADGHENEPFGNCTTRNSAILRGRFFGITKSIRRR